MKVFFIEPPHKIWEFFRGHTPAPGMTYVATYVEKDFDVKYIDATSGLERPWLCWRGTTPMSCPTRTRTSRLRDRQTSG